MDSASPSLQRTILRLVQTNEPIERSKLGLHSRSYAYDMENWEAVLDDLVSRGLITEDSVIRVGRQSRRNQKRAVIVYRMGVPQMPKHYSTLSMPVAGGPLYADGVEIPPHPKFADMTPEEVQGYVEKFPPIVPASAAS